MTDIDFWQWFYERLKSGKETPLSNSVVIFYLIEQMKG